VIDKNDIDSIIVQVPENWWITAESCKYMLACFVHKSNPDLNIDPKAAPAGATRESGRKVKKAALEEVRAVAKAARPVEKKGVEKLGDVDHQIKKARVDGMRSQVAKNQIDAIVQQIKVMRENEEILVGVHGKKEYDRMTIAALVIKMPGVEQVVSRKQPPLVDLMQTPTSTFRLLSLSNGAYFP
jgi:hypothetical protein